MKGKIWLCVEDAETWTRVWGDTGSGGFDAPYRPENCQYGGWLNHYPLCGWFHIERIGEDRP